MNNPAPTYRHGAHLSQEELLRYQAGDMSAPEMQRVERHLLGCALCSDALEGFAPLAPKQAGASLEELKARLAMRLDEQKKPALAPYWKLAAAAVLLLLLSVAAFLFFQPATPLAQPLAQEQASENDAPSAAELNESGNQDLPESPTAVQEAQNGNTAVAEAPKKGNRAALPAIEENSLALADKHAPARPEVYVEEKVNPGAPLNISLSGKVAGVSVQADSKVAAAPQTTARPVPVQTETSPPSLAEAVQAPKSKYAKAEKAAIGSREVRGKVVEATNGQPLPGVTVRIKGSSKGTLTDMNGEYTIELPQTKTTLQIGFIGYLTEVVPVEPGTSTVTTSLEEDVETLSEVVVIGRGRQEKRDATSAVSVVSAEPLKAPQPRRGMRHFDRYLRNRLQYPSEAARLGVEGEVVVEFYVNQDGSLDEFEVVSPTSVLLHAEAIRLLREGPRWQPATLQGEAVREKARVTIPFRLDNK